ncbi:DNA cross-link repair protein PSO2/SNM1 [Gnomoniopsis smithogilvyi]|uniref:DNA cross-link repair protein PSO2/SNM1 n=1 Tax=Gnomoniopsis smithogilvyi TaxID=1191159 RepID=A0A9W8Z311_9PEZI|nr:DNA cross-link repair protein PSO2/SNM1 [Gnomoniopsis smithogilvyi]
MARPNSASKTKPKPKPKRPAPKTAVSKTPQKRDSLTNNSILNFFQKVDRPEESMFVYGGAAIDPVANSLPKDHDDCDDIYGALDHTGTGTASEEKYNESGALHKRRKLSAADHDDANVPSATAKLATPKKPRRGPFLDDSDSEDDNDEPAPISSSVKTPPPEEEKEVRSTITSPFLPTKKPSRISLTPTTDSVLSTVPPPLKTESSTYKDYNDFRELNEFYDDEDLFASFEGEELREMRFEKEQARLEAQEAGDSAGYSCDDGFETMMEDDGMTESCPICNASLVGVTPDQATVHVNSCLDGNPTPLPRKLSPTKISDKQSEGCSEWSPLESCPRKEYKEYKEVSLVSAPDVGKRFARAAVARPGQASPFSLGGEESQTDDIGSTSAFSKLMSGHAEDTAWATAAAAETSARGKPAYQRTCPFYKIMPGFNICVDAFRYGAIKGCHAYFLSHFHSDHYIGLTANWTHGPIYCSKVTGSLVKSQLKTAEKYVIELEFEDKVPVPGTNGAFVTMIPANHCPGSSLFLFEKEVSNPNPNAKSKEKRLQRILHCGDFRACSAHVEHPRLKPEITDPIGRLKQQKIDVCYLDTTYLNPRYSFPPQNDVIQACADLCLELDTTLREDNEAEWNSVLRRREGRGAGINDDVSRFFVAADNKPSAKTKTSASKPSDPINPNALTMLGQRAMANRNRLLIVCGTYSIGKERICKAIALALQTKIFASPAKIRICSQLGDPELTALMTSNPHEAQVHMQMLMELRAETLAEYLDHHRPHFGRVIGLRPSGWSYRPTMANNGSGATAQVTANMPPSSVPTTQILHGPNWRTRFGPKDLVPQQGSSREAMCFGVPYSEHSSFRELMLFVMSLRIEKIVPTVNVGSAPSRKRMKGWTDRWLGERRRGGVVRVLAECEGELETKQEEQTAHGQKGKGKTMVNLWHGKDGRGGGVYW